MRPWRTWLVAFLVTLALIVLAFIMTKTIDDQYVMPLVAVISVLATFAVVAFIAAVYTWLGITNDKQPLALPEGSVRALLALILIIIFAVIALFMLPRLAATPEIGKELATIVQNEKPTPTGAPTTAAKAVDAMQARQNAATDLAKQLLTMLGTLLTSIASFYFGASSTASGANVRSGPTTSGGSGAATREVAA